jgi:hypothetical protein
VGLLGGGAAWGSQSGHHAESVTAAAGAPAHQHTVGHHTATTTTAPLPASAFTPTHGHGHGESVENQPLDAATRDSLAAQLVRAREAAARFPTVADAERAGYRPVTRYVPLIGAHYMKFSLVDGRFDIDAPEMLLYDGAEASSRVVGLSYYVRSSGEPEGFAGPNDHWHRHIGLCIDPKSLMVIGAESTSQEACRARGGVKAPGTDGWMVHAWVVPGWESPDGVFSAEHRDLR